MSNSLFLLEAFLLFVAPGPTNALLMAGAVKREQATKLLAAQACGYGIAAAFWLLSRPLMPTDAIQILKFVAVGWLSVLGLRLMASNPIEESGDVSGRRHGLSVLATTALNPKAFIYCLAMVPMDGGPEKLGIFWLALVGITAITGSLWVLLGKRLRGGRRVADKVAGAALLGFALLLLRPLLIAAAI
ncbi:LysE family transporter [Mesorhizobium sp. VK25A]|uniref:LysE family transporter n=1 Tax=Mesorhizobium vachelliae TaxID=3072309 RepID=A0ABU4ZZF1_9HYPH|nr:MULTISPECIES: LysE family transporter [unclassified Mesorhizobium]MDX8530796.1 LysE family transporter [Mesorhizobium sp. VK25D]MDX8542773.1 LysE family transporter [Mesorhizobium sp. VK25A]